MSFIIYNAIFLFNRVAIGSFQHIFPILFGLSFCILFVKYTKHKLNIIQQKNALHIFACFISLIVIVFHAHKINLGHYDVSIDLPLYLCSLLGLIIPVFTYFRKFWMYEVLLFWIVGGTLQAVLTPDIELGFPSFDYFRYWVVHLGLLIIIFYATFIFNMRPKLKSVFKSFLALQIYVVIMVVINKILGANYFYLNEKPTSASLLDYFGDWPWYIVVVQLIVIPLFLLIYLPFYFMKKRGK
ncbi:MAG: TIGR02206 family membrane protein [Algibacter sp.]|uniref:YwaF family protein n=1 Tax=Algibacter sp. TaxID=1872428 RepID=UPI00261A82D8|nr:TIGR02206 family membrane protein [Algibacter sp.]MDG1730707.1 TIGR02206 family membrane protein [Algibacter sp.]MDG2177858.1 TIGR02206 family membrane protein [Algibacter sp.]